jgi:hypothetical protein
MPEKRRRTMASDPQSSPTRPVQQNHAASNAFGDLISPKTPSAVSSRIMQARAQQGNYPDLASFCSTLKTSPYWPDLAPTLKNTPPACANATADRQGK